MISNLEFGLILKSGESQRSLREASPLFIDDILITGSLLVAKIAENEENIVNVY